MTGREWATFASMLECTFEGELDELTEAAMRRHLGDLEAAHADAAVALLVEDGQVFLPKPGEMLRAARRVERPEAPPWSEAWPVIARVMLRHGQALGNGHRREALIAIAEEVERDLGEGPARWVVRCADRLRVEPVNDPDVGGAVVKRLGDEYREACNQAAEDRKVGLALERARCAGELAAGRPAMRRLDPRRLLPQLPAGA